MRTISNATIYVFFAARSRWERRSEWTLRVLERYLPGRLKSHSLLFFGVWQLARFVVGTTAFGVAIFGLTYLMSDPDVLSLMFAFLLLAGAAVGLSTVQRTVIPPDQERLMAAPISDRRAYSLAFLGAAALNLSENTVVLPLVSGIAASVIFGSLGVVSVPALWIAVVLAALAGPPAAIIIDRLFGALRVRRVRKGVRSASVAGYILASAVVFVLGWLAARILVAWLSDFPAEQSLTNRWLLSLPEYVSDALSPLGPSSLYALLTHAFSPFGALTRGALGSTAGLLTATLWVATLTAIAATLWIRSGGWYRTEWRGGWQHWRKGDLFDLAERFYVGLNRLFLRRDPLLEVQVRNLCRRREWVATNAFDLLGGASNWISVGLAFGAAPALRESPTAAAIFALVIGTWEATENSRGPFVDFKESLVVDAEGHRAGLYRAAGVSIFDLYRAKLRTGRLIATPPLLVVLVLVAVLGGLSPAMCALLASAGLAGWVVGAYVELLPSLMSPHFRWDHPDELGDYYEQEWLSEVALKGLVAVYLVILVLVTLLVSGKIRPEAFPWLASAVMLSFAVSAGVVLDRLGRRVAKVADRMDFPA